MHASLFFRFFDGLILRKNKYLPLGKAKKYSTANILIGMENVSTLLEEHTSKYRLYNLALLQESDIPMSPNQGKSHNSESIRRPQLSSLLQVCTRIGIELETINQFMWILNA